MLGGFNLKKWLPWMVALLGWLAALIQWYLQHPFPLPPLGG